MDDTASLDATAQAELVRQGQASPAELVDAAIARVEALNPQLNAVIHERHDRARTEAAGDLPDGPFRGVPMVMKDLICAMEGEPFCEGAAFLKDIGNRSDHTQELARRFQRAGFVVVGRTNTPEFGILPTTEPEAFGPTRNPWDPARSTGGSSGGSAACVASGIVPVGHANDGGGSIRIPASECGLVGLKPNRARVPLGPEYGDVMGGLVCELVVTRSVRDTAAVLDALHGPLIGDPYAAPPAPADGYMAQVGTDPGTLRIGIMTASPTGSPVHADCVAATEAAGRLLETLGHQVEPSSPAALAEPDFTPHFVNYWAAGAAWSIDYWAAELGRAITADDVEAGTWGLAELGWSVNAAQWLLAREWLQANTRRVLSWWDDDGWDLLLTPTIAEPPPPLGSFDSPADNPLHGIFRAAELVPFTPPFNVTGQPAISVPLIESDEGLPIGIQLVGALGREDLLLRVAAQLEQASPWADRRPAIHA